MGVAYSKGGKKIGFIDAYIKTKSTTPGVGQYFKDAPKKTSGII